MRRCLVVGFAAVVVSGVACAGGQPEPPLVAPPPSANIDLLLTDVVLPRIGGRQLAERLRVARPDMKLLYMSGYTDDAIFQHGIIDSGVAFIQKPFTRASLTRKVRETMRGPTSS